MIPVAFSWQIKLVGGPSAVDRAQIWALASAFSFLLGLCDLLWDFQVRRNISSCLHLLKESPSARAAPVLQLCFVVGSPVAVVPAWVQDSLCCLIFLCSRPATSGEVALSSCCVTPMGASTLCQ